MTAPERPKTTISPAEALAQLSDPVRLRMMRVLCSNELAVGELVRTIQIPQSSGSRQLKLLFEGGWVVKRSVGPATYYRVLLDELSETMRGLWLAVRDDVDSMPDSGGDDQRVRSVLSERVMDSNAFFGEHAGQWDGLRSELFGQHFTDRALLSLIDPHWRVMDLGCGTGNCTELLSPWVEQIFAVDRSPEMLEGAKARLDNAGVRSDHVRFLEGDLTKIPLNDASVDAAVCMLVFHHIENPIKALKEMRRVLSTTNGGGVVLIVDMCAHTNDEFKRSMGHAHLGFTNEQISTMLTEAGFSRIRINHLRPDINSSGPPLFAAVARVEHR